MTRTRDIQLLITSQTSSTATRRVASSPGSIPRLRTTSTSASPNERSQSLHGTLNTSLLHPAAHRGSYCASFLIRALACMVNELPVVEPGATSRASGCSTMKSNG